MVRIRFPPAVSRQTIGSSAVIGVPDGDNPVQPIRPSRIGGKGRLIAEYADLIGAENLFAEYQCGLVAARGPPRSSPRRRPRRNPATSAGSRHRRNRLRAGDVWVVGSRRYRARQWRSPVPQSERKLFPKCELPHTSQRVPEGSCLRMGGYSSGECRLNCLSTKLAVGQGRGEHVRSGPGVARN